MDTTYFMQRGMTSGLDQRLGRSFWLTPDVERDVKAKHLKQVQALANREVSPDDFHVRGMLLCNSARDYYYSRFSMSALDEIAEMLPGTPVLRNHNYANGDPVARFFAGRRVRLDEPGRPKRDSYWVEGLFYFPADADGDRLMRRIDLGIDREVSIGWRCVGADCSECGKPIWACAHIPGDIYKSGIAEFEFSGITNVLEVSHVFRGGQKDTTTFVPDGLDDNERAMVRAAFADASMRTLDPAGLIALKKSRTFSCADELEAFLATSAHDSRAVGIFAALFGQRGDRANTQSVVCSHSRFESPQKAARWVRDHDFRADRRRDHDGEYRFEQFKEKLAEDGSFRLVTLDEGVQARVCRLKPPQEDKESERVRDSEADDSDSLESWLSREAATP